MASLHIICNSIDCFYTILCRDCNCLGCKVLHAGMQLGTATWDVIFFLLAIGREES